MSQTWIVTVGAARLGSADDPAGLLVARALLADGVPVASRQIVDEDETAVEEALRSAVEAASLVVVLAHPGGSSGEVVLLALLEEDYARRGQAMPRRLDRLALLPQGAVLWPGAGEPAWVLESKRAAVAVLPAGSAALGRGREHGAPHAPHHRARARRRRGAARTLARDGRASGGRLRAGRRRRVGAAARARPVPRGRRGGAGAGGAGDPRGARARLLGPR